MLEFFPYRLNIFLKYKNSKNENYFNLYEFDYKLVQLHNTNIYCNNK